MVGRDAGAGVLRHELGEESDESFVQAQTFCFLLQCAGGIGRGFQGVAKVGEAQEPERMIEAVGASHAVGDPAGVGQPAMALC